MSKVRINPDDLQQLLKASPAYAELSPSEQESFRTLCAAYQQSLPKIIPIRLVANDPCDADNTDRHEEERVLASAAECYAVQLTEEEYDDLLPLLPELAVYKQPGKPVLHINSHSVLKALKRELCSRRISAEISVVSVKTTQSSTIR